MTLPLKWWEEERQDQNQQLRSKRETSTIIGQISYPGMIGSTPANHPVMMNSSSSNLHGQKRSQLVVQSVGVQENGVHSLSNSHQVNGSSQNASNDVYNSSLANTSKTQYNPYQVEVRANGSNVLINTSDGYQYPLDPSVYGGCTGGGFDSRAGSWSCLTGKLEPKSKMFYLLSTLIVLGIAIMILTLIAAIVVFYQCEYKWTLSLSGW